VKTRTVVNIKLLLGALTIPEMRSIAGCYCVKKLFEIIQKV